jgi:hypothetical protein
LSARRVSFAIAWLLLTCGCSSMTSHPSNEEGPPPEPIDVTRQAIIDCSESTDTGYTSGQAFTITLVHVDGKPVERDTANAFSVMQQAAEAQGVNITVVSGFRTMAEQEYLYGCYVNCNCNNCNLAAKPGYSNHQSGHALDLNTGAGSVLSWLNAHGGEYGFQRTVPSESWHWEYWGGGPGGGPCGSCQPHCEGNTIVGQDCGKGDCAAYGSNCVDDNLGVRCAFYACPAQGVADICVNDSIIGHCENGGLSSGDCSAYGAFCSTAGGKPAHCASVFCVAGPNDVPSPHPVCLPNGQLAQCNADGGFDAAADCPSGKVCAPSAGTAKCIGAQAPKGRVDDTDCEAIRGWAQDPDEPAKAIDVHLYFGGPAGDPEAVGMPLHADLSRDDLCGTLGSCKHAFEALSPLSLLDGEAHPVHAYGIDSEGGSNAELAASPATLQCKGRIPDGVRRHVTNMDAFNAWHLSAFRDELPASDPQITAIAAKRDLPGAPVLVKSDDGGAEVWLIDGSVKRHVPDAAAFGRWGFAWGDVKTWTAAKLAGTKTGPALRSRPVLVKDTKGAVYVIDDDPDDAASPPGTGHEPRVTDGEGSHTWSGSDQGCSVATPGFQASGAWLVIAAAIVTWIGRRRRPAALLAATVLLIGCGARKAETESNATIRQAVEAPSDAFCTAVVEGIGAISAEDDYLPHVITCENGGAGLEALKAQAIAARSVLYYNMATKGSICNGQGCQVYSCNAAPGPVHYQAVKETAGQFLSYAGTLTYGFYVAGDSGTSPPSCHGSGGGTEGYVTYNEGLTGGSVHQTSLGWIGPAGNGQNRGCMGQWGARCLEGRGYGYADILRFYYGADIEIRMAGGSCAGCDPHCEGNTIVGSDCGKGDCSAYGSQCVQDNLGVRCSFYACPSQGQTDVCLNDQVIAHCDNGAVTTGDCSAYAAFCSTAGGKPAHCASAFCVAAASDVPVPHATCLPNGQLAQCNGDGGFDSAQDCPAGKVCHADAAGARCIGAQAPAGAVDAARCDALTGWAQDPDEPSKAIEVHVYFGGPAGDPDAVGVPMRADVERDEACGGTGPCEHGFEALVPLSLLDGAAHAVHVYGIDSEAGPNAELGASPATLKCATSVPAGIKRHVQDMDSFNAWKLSPFRDELPLTGAQIEAIPTRLPWPSEPVLARADDGSPEVWLMDQGSRRHVPDARAFAVWGFDWSKVQQRSASSLSSVPRGEDLPARPVAVKDSKGAVYLVDSLPAEGPGPTNDRRTSRPHAWSAGEEGGCSASGRVQETTWPAWLVALVLLRFWPRRAVLEPRA